MSHPDPHASDRPIEDDVHELQMLLPMLLRAFQRAGPHMDQLEAQKKRFFDAGLRDRHARVLFTLSTAGPLTVGQLAARVALTPATTSLLVGELNRAGFVSRREDDADRRRTIVTIPDPLRGMLEEHARARAEPLRNTLERLEPVARAHFVAGLRLLGAALGVDPLQ